jgi:hypothetical protein
VGLATRHYFLSECLLSEICGLLPSSWLIYPRTDQMENTVLSTVACCLLWRVIASARVSTNQEAPFCCSVLLRGRKSVRLAATPRISSPTPALSRPVILSSVSKENGNPQLTWRSSRQRLGSLEVQQAPIHAFLPATRREMNWGEGSALVRDCTWMGNLEKKQIRTFPFFLFPGPRAQIEIIPLSWPE